MKTNIRKQRGFTLVELLVVIAIIATLAGIATPVLMGQKKKGDLTKATLNAKQIGYAMFNFDEEFGSFPDTFTVEDLDDGAVLNGSGVGSSNGFFSQLIAAGHVDQEEPFYCKANFTKVPDNNRKTSSDILKAGEVGFSYVMRDSSKGLSSSVNSAIPLIVAASNGTAGKYDRSVYNKKAVVLRVDMSAAALSVDENNDIKLKGGVDLLSTDEGSPFKESAIDNPVIVDPQF